MNRPHRNEGYVDEYLTPRHQRFLADQFPCCADLGTAGSVSPLTRGDDNVNILISDADGVPRYVARHYLISSASRIAIELRLVTALAGLGFPTPAPHSTAAGKLFLDRSNAPGIAVFPFVEGKVARDWSHDQRRTAAAAIARVHQLCQQNGIRTGIGKPRREVLQWGAAFVSRGSLPGAAELFTEIKTFLENRLAPLEQKLMSLPSGPVHHDLNYGNVIWRDGDVAALIDFDECHDAPLIMDLVAAFSYVAQTSDYQLDREACLALIEGYDRVRRLEIEELRMLPLAWELLNLVAGVEYILRNGDRLKSVHDCRSYSDLYLGQKEVIDEVAMELMRLR